MYFDDIECAFWREIHSAGLQGVRLQALLQQRVIGGEAAVAQREPQLLIQQMLQKYAQGNVTNKERKYPYIKKKKNKE